MPIEASGQDWFGFAYGQDWQQHAGFFSAGHAKVLVRDNPGLDPARREQQARRLAQVSAWAAAAGRSLIIELLVPATSADQDATGGSQHRYDDKLRPGYTLAVMEYLQDRGVDPALWTVEGLDRHDDAVAVAATAGRADGRPAAWYWAGTPRTMSWSTGCRSPRRSPAGRGSRSAAASGRLRCVPTCTTSAPLGKPGAASQTPT